jgi:hypothetical protein
MKFARFWTREQGEALTSDGGVFRVSARGWSDESMAEAHGKGRDMARRLAQWVSTHPGQRNLYDVYDDRPVPEPILRDFRPGAPAAVTRNSYGVAVLNCDRLMFVDIDREDPKPRASFLRPIRTVFDDIREISNVRGLSARVYKTAGGHRAIVTNRAFPAGTDETESILRAFQSDELYLRLCRIQQSFRARLTPKPWRCDFHKPRVKFPYETQQAQNEIAAWEADYRSATAGFATCRLVGTCGPEAILPEFQELVAFHDRETKASSGLTLA